MRSGRSILPDPSLRRWLGTPVAGLLALSVVATDACAHAALVTAEPAAGARLTSPPAQVVLRFNEALEQKFSTVTLADGHGEIVAKAAGDPSNTDPAVIRLPLPKLVPGEYTVVWSAMTHDSHRTKGRYPFRVQ